MKILSFYLIPFFLLSYLFSFFMSLVSRPLQIYQGLWCNIFVSSESGEWQCILLFSGHCISLQISLIWIRPFLLEAPYQHFVPFHKIVGNHFFSGFPCSLFSKKLQALFPQIEGSLIQVFFCLIYIYMKQLALESIFIFWTSNFLVTFRVLGFFLLFFFSFLLHFKKKRICTTIFENIL